MAYFLLIRGIFFAADCCPCAFKVACQCQHLSGFFCCQYLFISVYLCQCLCMSVHGTFAHLGDGSMSPWAYCILQAADAMHHHQPRSFLSCCFRPSQLLTPLCPQHFSARSSGPSRHAISDCNLHPDYVSRLQCLRVFPAIFSQGCRCLL